MTVALITTCQLSTENSHWSTCQSVSYVYLAGKTLGAGLSLGHLSDSGSDYNLSAVDRENSTLTGRHVSGDIDSWWKGQMFNDEKKD